MYILGISALYHDSAAALIHDGAIIAAAQEERFTRIKHDQSIPKHAMQYCLKEAGIEAEDLDAVVYYDDPILTLDRFLANLTASKEAADNILEKSFDEICRKMWVAEQVRACIGGQLGKRDKLLIARHHLSHAASAFYPSPFEHAAVLTLDGVGEWNTTTIGYGTDNKIELLRTIDFPHSLGLLYSAFVYFCGFRVNYGDYKLMGLAPYGQPVYYDTIVTNLIDVKEDGSFRLNLKYFDFQNGGVMTNQAFAELFDGDRRLPESAITKREMDLAASVQKVVEEIVIKLAKYVQKVTGEMQNLVMAGGVALNCVANGVLKREGIFKNIFIQPAAGDAGGALGCALLVYYQFYKNKRTASRNTVRGSFLGPAYSPECIKDMLDSRSLPYHEFECDQAFFDKIAELLDSQNVIGIFQGRMEFGPRALGHRSIIADSRSPQMQAKLNLSIKYRESFRPFAPSVLIERKQDYFIMDYESPYMLFCAYTKRQVDSDFSLEEYLADQQDLLSVINRQRSDIPAVTHVDYSARVQTVDKERNPYFYRIIKAFEKRTGCGVVVNTSFNVRGEPIVCTPEDAYHCFMNTEMDVLVMENLILYKKEQPFSEKREDRYEPD